jgi:hypothetical protein
MTDQELRALVRQAVTRHLGAPPAPDADAPLGSGGSRPVSAALRPTDISHAMYLTLVNVGEACLIEPAVPCNHCGYCKTHGH